MMTAAYIAITLDITEITINYRFSEWLYLPWFNEHPVPLLELKVKENLDLINNFLNGVKIVDHGNYYEEILTHYPEEWDNLVDRVKKTLIWFKDVYETSDKRVAHIVVSHGI
jgi:hypothetical protein